MPALRASQHHRNNLHHHNHYFSNTTSRNQPTNPRGHKHQRQILPIHLPAGDAHVIRNAGGRASDDAIRSFVISHKLLGTTEW